MMMTTLTDDLPPLPEPKNEEIRTCGVDGFTADQMQAYARAAIAAHEAKQAQAEPVGYVTEETIPFLAECNVMDWCAIWNVPVGKTPIPLYTRPAPKREPLTETRTLSPEQIERHKMTIKDVPYDSEVLLVSSVRRLLRHGIKEAPKPARKPSADFDLPAPNDNIEEAP